MHISLQRRELVDFALIVALYFFNAVCNRWSEVCAGGGTISAAGGAGVQVNGETLVVLFVRIPAVYVRKG